MDNENEKVAPGLTPREHLVLSIFAHGDGLTVSDAAMYTDLPRGEVAEIIRGLSGCSLLAKIDNQMHHVTNKGTAALAEYVPPKPKPEPTPEEEPEDEALSGIVQMALSEITRIPHVVHDAVAALEREDFFDQVMDRDCGVPHVPQDFDRLHEELETLSDAARKAKRAAVVLQVRLAKIKERGES